MEAKITTINLQAVVDLLKANEDTSEVTYDGFGITKERAHALINPIDENEILVTPDTKTKVMCTILEDVMGRCETDAEAVYVLFYLMTTMGSVQEITKRVNPILKAMLGND